MPGAILARDQLERARPLLQILFVTTMVMYLHIIISEFRDGDSSSNLYSILSSLTGGGGKHKTPKRPTSSSSRAGSSEPASSTSRFGKEHAKILDEINDIYTSKDVYFQVLNPREVRYTFTARYAKNFGVVLNSSLEMDLVLAKPIDGCQPLKKDDDMFLYIGKAILVQRGNCAFIDKCQHAEKGGAAACIVYDNKQQPGDTVLIEMVHDQQQGGSKDVNARVDIPSVFISYDDGFHISNAIARSPEQAAFIRVPVNFTTAVPLHKRNLAPWTLW